MSAVLQRLTRASPLQRRWALALAVASLYLLAGWALEGVSGLVRAVVTNTSSRDELEVRRVTAIDLAGIDPRAGGASGIVVSWRGVWEVPDTGFYDLALASQGPSSWTIDDTLANQATSYDGGPTTRTVHLAAGFHAIAIAYEVDALLPRLFVAAARAGRRPQPLAPETLKPRPPRNPRARAIAQLLHGLLGCLALATTVWAVRVSIPAWTAYGQTRLRTLPVISSIGRPWPEWLGRATAVTLLAGILSYGMLLRIDAIAGRYGPVASPAWLAAVQGRSLAAPHAIRPSSITWQPEQEHPHRDGTITRYRSDPYTYLEAARTMTSFYEAHFREPIFPFATKVFLYLLGGQDVAVSFTSTCFSVLAIWFTYLLGASIWSRPVGLLAATGLALDHDVVSLASSGWRDDAYMAVVTLCVYLMLRWWRAQPGSIAIGRGPARTDAFYPLAALVGVAAGVAILTRIMAVSFLAAGAGGVLLERRSPWRRSLRAAALAMVTAVIIAAPYFVNCWRVYGDPLYTFNVHGNIYSAAEGQAAWEGSTAAYVAQKIAHRPFEMLDTVARGLTTYPFSNKWSGLDRWAAGLGEWASTAAIAGLLVLAAFREGRWLAMVMIASLVPFAFTWTVDPDFRFTEHVYPPLLIAAAAALSAGVRVALAVVVPGRMSAIAARWRAEWRGWAVTVGTVVAVLWYVEHVSPRLVFAEAVRQRTDVSVIAGARDRWSFDRGWSEVLRSGNVSMRIVTDEGALSIWLPDEADYPVTLRMDPFPRPLAGSPGLPVLDVVINGAGVSTVPLHWTSGRVGGYDVVLPRAAVRRGDNRLVLRVRRPAESTTSPIRPGLTPETAVGLWYVRVHPPLASHQ